MAIALFWVTLSIIFVFSSGITALTVSQSSTIRYHLVFIFLGLAGVSAVIGGSEVLFTGTTITTQWPWGLPGLAWHLRLDPLSGFFFIIIGLLTTAVSFYAPAYLRNESANASLGLFTALFIAGMMLVLLADDVLMFMIAWELMSLSSYFLVVHAHTQPANRRAGFLYLLMAHIGALTILLSFAVLVVFAQGLTFAEIRQAQIPMASANLAFGLGLFGFGMKAGLAPIHAWLPEAHPVAPSHISALMSGVMLKIAIYGLMRLTLDLLGTPHWSWGVILLLIGATSALLGILYALLQNDLKRLLAYSSIENIGIICMGFGLGLLFLAKGQLFLGALGITASLYHALNHAVFKGLLFLSAGAILHSTHERHLENLGGLIRYLPYTSVFVLIGCLAISALPPFNGFVSEWLIFQTALQAPILESGVLRALVPFSAALLALTSALSATCFVKLYGVTFLGQPRITYHTVHEVSLGMRMAQGFLATLCLLLGILPTTLINVIEIIPRQLIGVSLPSLSEEGWLWLTPISAQVASYSAPLVLLSILAVWGIVYLMLHSTRQTRRTGAWDCGFGPLNSRMQYTATAFAMPLRRIFKPAWRIEERIDETKDEKTLYRTTIRYQLHIGDRSWPVLYVPLGHLTGIAAHFLGKIQTGNIRTYLAYSFFTLIALLWLIT